MLKKSILLIFTIIVVPLIAFKYGKPLTELQSDILNVLLITCFGIAISCFIVSEISKNYSQTDKLWSITPIIYTWIACAMAGWPIRMIFLAILVTIWGARLTYNFSRRGGYSLKFWEGVEDYRWVVLRQKKPFDKKWVFSLFNLFFISLYQHFLILFFTLPVLLSVHTEKLFWMDYVLGAFLLLFVIIETKADQQQWDYQTEKYRRLNNNEELGEDYARGFLNKGLWSISRHPNYAMEQSIWLVFYLFSTVATGQLINWSIIGVLLLMILFRSSSDFSESISASKYKDYKNYQNTVGRFIPKFLPKKIKK